MSLNLLGFTPAKILSYNAVARTAQISIAGLTDGAENGLTAIFAYPVGDDDLDTERQILAGADVYVFFEEGQSNAPVIAFFRSHGEGAVVNTRRIRQQNIEILGQSQVKIKAPTIRLIGTVIIDGDIQHTGNQHTTGTVEATVDVIAGGVSGKTHPHGGVLPGNSSTLAPTPTA